MQPLPAVVEVFGDDGELFAMPLDDASDAAIEDGIAILEQRRREIDARIRELSAELDRRAGLRQPSPEQIRANSRRQSIAGLIEFACMGGRPR